MDLWRNQVLIVPSGIETEQMVGETSSYEKY